MKLPDDLSRLMYPPEQAPPKREAVVNTSPAESKWRWITHDPATVRVTWTVNGEVVAMQPPPSGTPRPEQCGDGACSYCTNQCHCDACRQLHIERLLRDQRRRVADMNYVVSFDHRGRRWNAYRVRRGQNYTGQGWWLTTDSRFWSQPQEYATDMWAGYDRPGWMTRQTVNVPNNDILLHFEPQIEP